MMAPNAHTRWDNLWVLRYGGENDIVFQNQGLPRFVTT